MGGIILAEKVGYVRVSTSKQNRAMQEEALISAGCQRVFSDAASGSNIERPGLDDCLNYMRTGDTLVVWKSDRLGRSTIDLLKIVDTLRERGIGFKSLTEELFDTTSHNGKLIFGIFALLAEHERERIRERTRSGLASARARGRVGGRPHVLKGEKEKVALKALRDPEVNIRELAKGLGVGEATIYRFRRQMKATGKLLVN